MSLDRSFWSDQRIFLTGHTGFKGAWASLWLEELGAKVFGFALAPTDEPNLYGGLAPFERQHSTIGDIGSLASLRAAMEEADPTLLLHMAAQPLVRASYALPLETFATNMMGTAQVLEVVREAPRLHAGLIVTTDKVYHNSETGKPFAERDRLGGYDPYSASKAAAEIITASYGQSFFAARSIPIATARAGNVIGGGDWSADRLVPDIWRACRAGEPLVLRYPGAVRPWQHVLDSLSGYFRFLERLSDKGETVPRTLNFGPANHAESVTVAEVAELVARGLGAETAWIPANGVQPAEMQTLTLDASEAARTIGWRSRLNTREALDWTADWYRRYDAGESVRDLTLSQIRAYEMLS